MLANLTNALARDSGPTTLPSDMGDRLLGDDAPPRMRELVDYWDSLRVDGALPSFSDVDPVEIPWALSSIYVIRVVDGGMAFRYRLCGEEINRRYGLNLAGKSAADLFRGAAVDVVTARWRRIAGQPAACRMLCRHHTRDERAVVGDRVMLPLSDDGRTVDHILGWVAYHDKDRRNQDKIAGSETLSATWVGLP